MSSPQSATIVARVMPKRRRVTMTCPAYCQEPLPVAAAEVAERRTAHLESLAFRQPIRELLVSAYMQGIVDSYQAMTRDAMTVRAAP